MVPAESVEEVRGTARNMEAGDSFPAAGTELPDGRVTAAAAVATSAAMMGSRVGTAAAVVAVAVAVAVMAAQEVS